MKLFINNSNCCLCMGKIRTVSYTHLDVYKRQILGYEELDEGNIVKSPVASIGYLQQDVNLGDDSLATEIEKAWAEMCIRDSLWID